MKKPQYPQLMPFKDFEVWSVVNEDDLNCIFAETGADREMDFDREAEELKIYENDPRINGEELDKFISKQCEGVKCQMCENDATHKVGEVIFTDDPYQHRHNLTAYVCCECFAAIFGPITKEFCKRWKH